MKLYRIFISMSGEQNAFGIGYPSLFVRFYGCRQGCNGCDTPEAMTLVPGNPHSGKYEEIEPDKLFDRVRKLAERNNLGLITITGGEPLEQDTDDLLRFLELCKEEGLYVSIETNGMESIEPFLDLPNVNFVVDWKMPSAGVKEEMLIPEQIGMLGDDDYVKIIVKDERDLEVAIDLIKEIRDKDCKIAIGLHSLSPFSYQDLMDTMMEQGLLGDLTFNFQAHKLLKLA